MLKHRKKYSHEESTISITFKLKNIKIDNKQYYVFQFKKGFKLQ